MNFMTLSYEFYELTCQTVYLIISITTFNFWLLDSNGNSKGGNVGVPPQINIWAGTKKFSLGGGESLTAPELDRLAQDLSKWLNLHITKENV